MLFRVIIHKISMKCCIRFITIYDYIFLAIAIQCIYIIHNNFSIWSFSLLVVESAILVQDSKWLHRK